MTIVGTLIVGMVADSMYKNRALPGSQLAGHDISGLTDREIDPVLTEVGTQISVGLTVDGTTQTATAQDLGITVDRQLTLARVARGSTRSFWLFRPHTDRTVPLAVTIDATRFNAWGEAHFPGRFVPAVDAGLNFDPTAGQYEVTPAVAGTGVTTTRLAELA
ncbi:MAG: hypothetical protein LBI33_08475, partial [Propionibacteriaceae bacterium]|nr:hypothetical protein [Propionibacteriaceae bacterium]